MHIKLVSYSSDSTFIKLPFDNKIFVLSIFEWLLKTGVTILSRGCAYNRLNTVRQLPFGDFGLITDLLQSAYTFPLRYVALLHYFGV